VARGRRPLKSVACVQEPCGCIGPSPARDRRGVPECNGNAQHGEKAVFEGRYREGGPTRHAQPLWPAYLPPFRNLYARQLFHATEIHEEPFLRAYRTWILRVTIPAKRTKLAVNDAKCGRLGAGAESIHVHPGQVRIRRRRADVGCKSIPLEKLLPRTALSVSSELEQRNQRIPDRCPTGAEVARCPPESHLNSAPRRSG